MAKVLVTGGAGFIGSHTVRRLRQAGHHVVVFDSLEKGHAAAIRDVPLRVGSLEDVAAVAETLAEETPDAVVHFAAYIEAGESMKNPGKYFRNNTANTLSLLQAMAGAGVGCFLFSSTAAVYGNPAELPIPETAVKAPTNPYGESKWLVERALPWIRSGPGIRSVSLRYFNAAGASPDGDIGESHDPETHLIPLILETLLGKRPVVRVFGTDYPTPDGTCVRDYIHVDDLARAHVLALDALLGGDPSPAFNVGTGRGHSVREVIAAVGEVTGMEVPVAYDPPRAGDPAMLVACSDLIRQELGWSPMRSDLHSLVRDAWRWASGPGFGAAGG